MKTPGRTILFEFSNGGKAAIYTMIFALVTTCGGWVWSLSQQAALMDRMEQRLIRTVELAERNQNNLQDVNVELQVLLTQSAAMQQDVTRIENLIYGGENGNFDLGSPGDPGSVGSQRPTPEGQEDGREGRRSGRESEEDRRGG